MGLLIPGNIDLNNRPVVRNPDGSISTVFSTSVNFDGQEFLIPQVSDDGRMLSTPEAIAQFKRTGKHLGVFDTPAAATEYAQQLHEQQAERYMPSTYTPEQLQQFRQKALDMGDTELADYYAEQLGGGATGGRMGKAVNAAADSKLAGGFGRVTDWLGEKGANIAEDIAPIGGSNFDEVDVSPMSALATVTGPRAVMAPFEPNLLERVGYLFAPSEEARARLLKKMKPGTRFGEQDGSITATPPLEPGEMGPPAPQFINRPGLSPIDVKRAGVDFGVGAATIPFGGEGFWPLAARMGGRSAITAGQSLAEDAISKAAGGGNPIDVAKAGLYGLLSAGGDIAAKGASLAKNSAVGQKIRSMLPSLSSPLYNPATGQFSKHAQSMLEGAGVDLNRLSDKAYPELASMLERGADPAQAFRIVQAKTLESPVRLSSAAIRQDPKLAALEDTIERAGDDSSRVLAGDREARTGAIRENIDALSSQVGGGAPALDTGGAQQVGENVQARLAAMRDQARGNVDQAFANAESRRAFLDPGYVNGLVDKIQNRITSTRGPRAQPTFHPSDIPKSLEVLGRLRESADRVLGSGTVQVGTSTHLPLEIKGADLADVMDFRKKLNTLIGGNLGTTEGMALGEVKRAFDTEMDDVFAQGMVKGDLGALASWRDAFAQHADLKKTFDRKDVVGKMLAPKPGGAKGELAVEPSEAINTILGRSYLGFDNPAVTQGNLLKLRGLLGTDSAEWKGVKQAALDRLMRSSVGDFTGKEFGTSGVKLKKAIDTAMEKNPAVFSALFTDAEKKSLRQFGDVAALATGKQAKATNPSGTAGQVLNSIRSAIVAGTLGYGTTKAVLEGDTGPLQVGAVALPLMMLARGAQNKIGVMRLRSQTPQQRPMTPGSIAARQGGILSLLQSLNRPELDPYYDPNEQQP